MFDESLITACKLLSLAIFFPIYLGALAYAFGAQSHTMDAYARIPLTEEGGRTDG